jgi:hypothetical protein
MFMALHTFQKEGEMDSTQKQTDGDSAKANRTRRNRATEIYF